jgi:tetratricopeptide (TPR) repeat protein
MKRLITVIIAMVVAGYGYAQSLMSPPSGNNQKAKVVQNIGPVEISIAYSSPHVHTPKGDDRTGHIWGELVPYGFQDQGAGFNPMPWRAGANENTVIKFSHDVKIDGKDLKAGSYALFLAPAKEGPWTWIFSNNSTSWGSFFYDQKEDALRVDVTPVDAPFTEYLMYGFDERTPNYAIAYLQWENKRIPLKIEAPNANDIYLSMIRNQLRSPVGFDYRNYSQAANFCAQNKINLDEALKWADRAINPLLGGKDEMATFQAKAAVLRAMGKETDADALMDKAIKLPSTSVTEIHQYARGLLNAGKKEKAMEVFKYNAEKNLGTDKFTPNVGLARGYTAMGDTKKAITYWEEAIKNIPENQKPFIKTYQGELDKLKSAK